VAAQALIALKVPAVTWTYPREEGSHRETVLNFETDHCLYEKNRGEHVILTRLVQLSGSIIQIILTKHILMKFPLSKTSPYHKLVLP